LNDYLDFPHVAQVFRLDRVARLPDGTERSDVCYGITSLDSSRASAARILELNRGHWQIENRLHYVRDVSFDEDRCRARTKHGARVMASLRNLVITLIRLLGFAYIPDALRHFGNRVQDPLSVLGI
jgi:ribosomal protein S16